MDGQATVMRGSIIGINPEDSVNKSKNAEKKEEDGRSNIGVHYFCVQTNEEENKVVLMREFLQKHDPSVKEIDDSTLRRFLRARDQDIEKASSMFLKYLKWKQTFVPKGYISASEITEHLAQNKQFSQGFDKQGRPISVVFGGRHFPSKLTGGVDGFKRFVVFALDKICSRMPSGQEKFVMIGDLEGWGYCNTDIKGSLGALSILQSKIYTLGLLSAAPKFDHIRDYHPERLGKLFIVHAPYIFMTMWKIVYPFIDNNTRKKLVFVDKKRLKETLLEDIDESQIPEIYGGKLPLVPIQDS